VQVLALDGRAVHGHVAAEDLGRGDAADHGAVGLRRVGAGVPVAQDVGDRREHEQHGDGQPDADRAEDQPQPRGASTADRQPDAEREVAQPAVALNHHGGDYTLDVYAVCIVAQSLVRANET
jgi:hypothetical protein